MNKVITNLIGLLSKFFPVATASKANKRGTQIPSFKPLSALRSSRILSGTFGLLTTAFPKAASVGANMTASMAASTMLNSGNKIVLSPKPSKIVSGSPIARSRQGKRKVFFKIFTLALAASVKRMRARVNSVMVLRFSEVKLN